MLPTEAAAAMAADRSLGLAVERRDPDAPVPELRGLRVLERVEHRGTAGVQAWLVRAHAKPWAGPGETRKRLIDRFYVPNGPDEALTGVLFDLVAQLYEMVVDLRINRATAGELLREAIDTTNPVPAPRVLDFGCGTGIAAGVLARLGCNADLIGTDLSPAMLARAAASGEQVMSIGDWRREPPQVAGAIASFVLHYGVSDDDLTKIAASLLPGGTFAANYFKPTAAEVERLMALLGSAGLRHLGRRELAGTRSSNLLLSFRKPR